MKHCENKAGWKRGDDHPLNQSRPEARARPSGRTAKRKRPPGED
jgi:hypothetical protein